MTSKEDIFELFSNKINDVTYLSYSDEEIEREFNRFLTSAKARFYSCDKLAHYDEFMEEFKETLEGEEIEILTEFMVLMWIERQVQDITRFKDRLSSKDYSGFSKANLLDKIEATRIGKSSHVDKLMSIYGNKIAIARLKR